MTRRRRLLLGCLLPVALLLAACGGAAPAAGGDPAGVTRQAMSLMQAKDITGLTNLSCAAQRDSLLDSFTGDLGGSGIPPEQVLDAINIDTSKVTVGQATESGDTASVALGGTISLSFDETKMRDIVKAQLEAQGQPTDDATIEMAMGFIRGMGSQPIPLEGETLELIRENGTWKICDGG